ncbi:MAG: hypothetical protein PHS44_06495 [Candidatus Dojkabacteria bacterium]|jgi:hypothetical protein|nr:hypothetical protein [Candidatus Dojkabacteria bacterium]
MTSKVKNTILGLRLFNGCSASVYGFVVLSFCALPLVFADIQEEEEIPLFIFVCCMSILFLGILGLFVAYFIGTIKAALRSRKIWVLQVFLVGLGLGSTVLFIPSFILLINLLSDEVQEYYKSNNK